MAFVPQPSCFYAEKGSKTYYPGSNAWVLRINPKRLLEFKTEEEAQAAGLKSFSSGSNTKTASKKTHAAEKGKLVGLKTDKLVHAPRCPLIKDKPSSTKTFINTLEAAETAGRAPCRSCIRLGDPKCPQPAKGECMGRMPMYFRPCFGKIATESGLCKICSGLVE